MRYYVKFLKSIYQSFIRALRLPTEKEAKLTGVKVTKEETPLGDNLYKQMSSSLIIKN